MLFDRWIKRKKDHCLEPDLLSNNIMMKNFFKMMKSATGIVHGSNKRVYIFDNYVVKLPRTNDHSPILNEFLAYVSAPSQAKKFLCPIEKLIFLEDGTPALIQDKVSYTIDTYAKEKFQITSETKNRTRYAKYSFADFCLDVEIPYSTYIREWNAAFTHDRDTLENKKNMGWHDKLGIVCIDYSDISFLYK